MFWEVVLQNLSKWCVLNSYIFKILYLFGFNSCIFKRDL